MLLDLANLFDALKIPEASIGNGQCFVACPIPTREHHRLAKDAEGNPAILLSVASRRERERPSPVILEHVTVQHDVECRIGRPDGATETGRFTAILCTGADRQLRTYFLRAASTLLSWLSATPSAREVDRAIGSLIELFR